MSGSSKRLLCDLLHLLAGPTHFSDFSFRLSNSFDIRSPFPRGVQKLVSSIVPVDNGSVIQCPASTVAPFFSVVIVLNNTFFARGAFATEWFQKSAGVKHRGSAAPPSETTAISIASFQY
jgi:hypothetical protein